jgi:hypothetical protein
MFVLIVLVVVVFILLRHRRGVRNFIHARQRGAAVVALSSKGHGGVARRGGIVADTMSNYLDGAQRQEQLLNEDIAIANAGLLQHDGMGLKAVASGRLPRITWVAPGFWDKLGKEVSDKALRSTLGEAVRGRGTINKDECHARLVN